MNEEFLTELQERQMSFQPDFILEYAHYLGDHFTDKGVKDIEVYADSYVTLNGRMNKRFIDPFVNFKIQSFKYAKSILSQKIQTPI